MPTSSPSAPAPRSRRRWAFAVAGIVVVLALTAGVRHATFDPQQFARDVEAELSPFPLGTVETLRGIASAPSDASAAPLIMGLPADLEGTIERYATTMASMRRRFHGGSGPCMRYPTNQDGGGPPEPLDEVVDAIFAAELGSRVDALARSSSRWEAEEDAKQHKSDRTAEVMEYFTDAASAWKKLGIAMHRKAVEASIRDVAERTGAIRGELLRPDEEPRGKVLSKRFGHRRLLGAGLKIAQRKSELDLRAPQLRLVEPGMSRAAVRGRLGVADQGGERWRYSKDRVEVSFDRQDHVTGVVFTLRDGLSSVIVDGKRIVQLDEPSLTSVMGKPLRDAEGEAGETVLVYAAGPHARLLVFEGGHLTRIELWRRDLVVPSAP